MPDDPIRWLLVAESPPCPRDESEAPYIYRIVNQYEERPILEALVSAFMKSSGDRRAPIRKDQKLAYIKKTERAFVMDLCCYPLNRYHEKLRDELRDASEYDFYLRLVGLPCRYHRKVENIIVIGKKWHEYVLQAVDTAGMGGLVRNRNTPIPFPSSWRRPGETQTGREKCIDLLSEIFADPEYGKK
jgi:hypothetical protein